METCPLATGENKRSRKHHRKQQAGVKYTLAFNKELMLRIKKESL
jgi:hypothetical protein